MSTAANLSPLAQQIEAQFDQPSNNSLQRFLRDTASRQLEAIGATGSTYDIFLVRRNAQVGDEALGPKQLHNGNYPEEFLYGTIRSEVPRFMHAIRDLADKADKIVLLDPEELDYGHRVALFWADIGRIKSFIGVSTVISEIAAELRIARFQMLGQDTPLDCMHAVAQALRLLAGAKRLDEPLVDRFVEVLETGGIDSFAQEALRDDPHA